jgi:catechol 2,3-dioxygenase-like lactoylglutathione lyase family enzyme
MKYKMTHFGLLCEDIEKSLDLYCQKLDHQLMFRIDDPNIGNLAFVAKGSKTMIELVGRPFLPYEENHVSRQGYGINHISLQVDDADQALVELKAKGLKVAWETKTIGFLRQCGFYDEDGLIVEVYSERFADSLPTPDLDQGANSTEPELHHISILTTDLIRSEKFYVENFGMKRVAEYFNKGNERSGGFVFLVDPFYDGKDHTFLLEIIGGPGLEEREEILLKEKGSLFDHICYATNDVKRMWGTATQKGVENFIEPYQEYESEIAWIKDTDGNDIEILSPFSEEMTEAIIKGGPSIKLSI